MQPPSPSAPTLSRVRSFAFSGIDAVPVTVEVQIASGLPAFLVVGLADKSVAEARERVRAALTALGIALPPKRILVNLVPADIPKEGSHFDLPIALAVLLAMGVLPGATAQFAALGELSLDGRLNPVTGVLSAALGATQEPCGLICPETQSHEARWASPTLDILAPPDLKAIVEHLQGERSLPAIKPETAALIPPQRDLADVKGMPIGRRVLEIAAAGGHSLLFSGPPGAGKSMLASRLAGILPDLTAAQMLEATRIHSVSGHLEDGRPITRPPYRDPHHSASLAAIVGGGQRARPGEVSLAHHGVLFLDELPEFSRQALESLRQPIETGRISVARAARIVTYPARFQLVAAMNPCRCGYLGDMERSCRKAPRCGEDYAGKISGPMLDRIDLFAEIQPVSPIEISRAAPGESSAAVRQRVEQARASQIDRQGVPNAEADPAAFMMDEAARALAEEAGSRLRLSARGLTRLLRVARTIADMAADDVIQRPHMAEALSFRHR